jgi:hypothetical protein
MMVIVQNELLAPLVATSIPLVCNVFFTSARHVPLTTGILGHCLQDFQKEKKLQSCSAVYIP